MKEHGPGRPPWHQLLEHHSPLQLPAAHDALTAKLIKRAGFHAYQIGGFALVGSRHGLPDVDLTRFAEQSAGVRDILAASDLPVLVDADDGYGDAKNVTHTIRSYEAMGVSAVFIEDQVAPKRCGHMSGKEVVDTRIMVQRIEAAAAARRSPDFFIVARTDALGVEGLDAALKRGEQYLKAGADGIYVEAPRSVEELETIGAAFKGTPQMTNMFEGDNQTPWLTPMELHALGFSMILYPTSLLFRAARAIERGLADLRQGKRMEKGDGLDLEEYELLVDTPYWAVIEKRFGARQA
ncbi:MAG TPA: isocitrate lyase/PEP mutase family protein [Vicinamibacterales bacterium]|jgi:2-methylisocitrate lyase-like PEP mutase family enzyme